VNWAVVFPKTKKGCLVTLAAFFGKGKKDEKINLEKLDMHLVCQRGGMNGNYLFLKNKKKYHKKKFFP